MVKPIKPLAEQIDEYKNDYRFHDIHEYWDWRKGVKVNLPTWNWDEEWDGQLIKDVTALEQAGFTIVSFSRKRKVTLKLKNKVVDDSLMRLIIVETIIQAVGDSWYSISFKPTLSIYWKGRSGSWKY